MVLTVKFVAPSVITQRVSRRQRRCSKVCAFASLTLRQGLGNGFLRSRQTAGRRLIADKRCIGENYTMTAAPAPPTAACGASKRMYRRAACASARHECVQASVRNELFMRGIVRAYGTPTGESAVMSSAMLPAAFAAATAAAVNATIRAGRRPCSPLAPAEARPLRAALSAAEADPAATRPQAVLAPAAAATVSFGATRVSSSVKHQLSMTFVGMIASELQGGVPHVLTRVHAPQACMRMDASTASMLPRLTPHHT